MAIVVAAIALVAHGGLSKYPVQPKEDCALGGAFYRAIVESMDACLQVF